MDLRFVQIDNIAKEGASCPTKVDAARYGAQKAIEQVAAGVLDEAMQHAIVRTAANASEVAQRTARDIDAIKREAGRLESLLTRAANISNSTMSEKASDAATLFATLLNTVVVNFKSGDRLDRLSPHNLDSSVQVMAIRAASYIVWAYLQGGEMPSFDTNHNTK